jgi:hypothetical protein
MPINAAQLAAGANYTLATYATNDPVDQFTAERPFADWLIANKQESSFGNGIFNEKVRITNDSNYQNYTRDDSVSYNRKDTVRLAPFQHYEAHDGFSLNETDLSDNGIIMTDDKTAVATDAEKIQIVNKLQEGYATLKDGFQENWDKEVHLDGSQSALAVPGLDALVSVDGTGVIGGIDASVTANAYWKNNFNTGIAATSGVLIAAMEVEWRKCITHGKMGSPDYIVCGSKFLDAYAKDVRANPGTTMMVTQPAKGGAVLDGSRSGVFFKGVELVWDPTFDTLQAALNPTINWDKRCYFLNKKALKLRPNRGRWMVSRKPPRIYDRYTYYFGLTADYGLTVKQRNAMSLLSIA